MKEKLTQQALLSTARRFHDFLIFAGLSLHTKAASSNPFCIYDLHLLYDQNVGCVIPDLSPKKTPFPTHLWFTSCAVFCIPLVKSCASSQYFFVLLLPSLLTLTHAHSIFFSFHLNLTFQASYSMTPCLFASL